jgi:hypothetical protein
VAEAAGAHARGSHRLRGHGACHDR